MTSKIKIRMGQIEIEYEGSEAFLKDELPALLQAVTELYSATGAGIESSEPVASFESNVPKTLNRTREEIGTTNSIAAKLSVRTGPELAVAAAARLVIGLGKGQFTRRELLEEMKSATQYYKSTYSSNLGSSLKTLVSDQKFIERSKDTYALKADIVSSLEARLA